MATITLVGNETITYSELPRANEGIENVVALSDYKTRDFGKTYGLNIVDGPFEALHSRCIIVIDENGTILHTEQVEVISDEPDYDAAINALEN